MVAGTLPPSSASSISNLKLNGIDKDEHSTDEKSRTDTNGRSAALERAYVHDVYENCEEPVGSIRPKVAQFLAGLDAGSVVCDVGCGNGRYLTSHNPYIYTVGVDRCYRLSKISKGRGAEVALCDNLELPFRDNSFDAVLSLAVVHHFATTERRVGAIKELARILRIGGRVIITVWALEQKQRRFESQDVLIPWQKPRTAKNSICSDEEDDDDYLTPYHAYTEDSTQSSRSTSAGDGDSSSLSSSSPGESCYSFVRRAIKKLASSKSKHPWFLDSWNSKDTKNDSSLDYEDVQNLPIELRRLEDFDDMSDPPLSASLKSRSLGSILNPPPPQIIVRSRSSVPSLGAHLEEKVPPIASSSTSVAGVAVVGTASAAIATERSRPKLIKQKQSLCDGDDEFTILPGSQFKHATKDESRILLRKQSSLNEELMAESRLRERDHVRKRIQKQISLNEAFLCRSVFTKRLQVIRDGFTTKLKTSTGSLERITKTGIVKIMQNFKSSQSQEEPATKETHAANGVQNKLATVTTCNIQTNGIVKVDDKLRKHSMESGSDSSKDSSLQSDTSIESEDSFASVIYIPRTDQNSAQVESVPSNNNIIRIPSVPTSPLVMPCPTPAHSPAPQRYTNKLGTTIEEASKFIFETEKLQHSDVTAISKVHGPVGTAKKLYAPSKSMSRKSAATATAIATPIATSTGKITKNDVKNMPIIPKFRKANSCHSSSTRANRNIVPAVPKYSSLELYNPETDDIDSDSSEPSSPDSIDSVINALKPTNSEDNPEMDATKANANATNDEMTAMCNDLDAMEHIGTTKKSTDDSEGDIDTNAMNGGGGDHKATNGFECQQQLVDFAEQLSAQLLKELNKDNDEVNVEKCTSNNSNNNMNHNGNTTNKLDGPITINLDESCFIKRLNNEHRNLSTLREELRERRLMLANLKSHNYPNSSNSTSSTIHEEDEISPTQTSENELEFDNFISKNDYDANRDQYAMDKQIGGDRLKQNLIVNSNDNLELCHDSDSLGECSNIGALNTSREPSIGGGGSSGTSATGVIEPKINARTLETRKTVDSWTHSNSTVSLDSPSGGGASTHHRYYHVFREGELDSLINHHVASLHIVSSYYERASWCVVAEKVQVWTI